MPKQKTKRAAMKRFSLTGTGKIKRSPEQAKAASLRGGLASARRGR